MAGVHVPIDYGFGTRQYHMQFESLVRHLSTAHRVLNQRREEAKLNYNYEGYHATYHL